MLSSFANILGDLATTFYSDLPPQQYLVMTQEGDRDVTPPVEEYPAANMYDMSASYVMPSPFYAPNNSNESYGHATDQVQVKEESYGFPTPSPSPELLYSPGAFVPLNCSANQSMDQSCNLTFDQSLNGSTVEKRKIRRRSKKAPNDAAERSPQGGQHSRECVLCRKEIEGRNVNRHALFHTKIFRYSCSICDYQSHMKCNVKTHLKLRHDIRDDASKIIENLSQELVMEIARVFEECFPGQTKTAASLKSYNGRKSIEFSYLNDSAISMNSTVNATLKESPQQKYEEIIAKRTCSNRMLRTLEKNVMVPCQRCDKLVVKPKRQNHSITHASTHRYRCSICGVGHHCQYNLRSHIKSQHENQAEVMDEITPELEAEYERLLAECFPEMAESRRQSIDSTFDRTAYSIDTTGDRSIDMSTSVNEGEGTADDSEQTPVRRSNRKRSINNQFKCEEE